ncbi:rod-binding protein [Bradyrhizobium diazoefficiens]|nr:rod-binding protein [Bradyrhizobium diazoefficiens]MBR0776497.1 rod-binding protein [Bradyrhizobium diazoefficiens]MBR0850610.1 rod-binding protein [Bradyrhizobium diazoefficiens]
MIVTATPDLVLDVLDAADPVAQRTATAKLDALKSPSADFAATMEAEFNRAAARTSEAQSATPNAAPVKIIKAPGPGEVYRKFEAFILQSFVDTMLPKDSEVFGKGTAGSVWKSMLAEQLGNQLAQGKGIGIARQLAAGRSEVRDISDKAG